MEADQEASEGQCFNPSLTWFLRPSPFPSLPYLTFTTLLPQTRMQGSLAAPKGPRGVVGQAYRSFSEIGA